jgi:protocatechuate 3,4-dioxygenase alpha subunit
MSLRATTSQTIGPYLRIGLEWMVIEDLAPQGVAGERVRIEGRVLDGDGRPVNDAASRSGRPTATANTQARGQAGEPTEQGFRGYGRSLTDDAGAFRFRTIKLVACGPDGKLQRRHYRHDLHAGCSSSSKPASTFPTIRPTPTTRC